MGAHHLAVLERAERHRDAAAVRAAGHADRLRIDQPFTAHCAVGELIRERLEDLLRVTHLVAGVHQVVVAVGAHRQEAIRIEAAAGVSPAAVAHREDGVAGVEPFLHRAAGEPELRSAPAVEDADDRKVAVGTAARRRRKADVDVDRSAVEGGEDARAVALAGVDADLDGTRDRSAEDVRDRGLGDRPERQAPPTIR